MTLTLSNAVAYVRQQMSHWEDCQVGVISGRAMGDEDGTPVALVAARYRDTQTGMLLDADWAVWMQDGELYGEC